MGVARGRSRGPGSGLVNFARDSRSDTRTQGVRPVSTAQSRRAKRGSGRRGKRQSSGHGSVILWLDVNRMEHPPHRWRSARAQSLEATPIVDWDRPEVLALARALAEGRDDPVAVARRCFEWVRDEIKHSGDHRLDPVTCSASQVLRHGTGFCYAKSHLLAALLRANAIPAGFCYQRLSIDGAGPPSACTASTRSTCPESAGIASMHEGIEPGSRRPSIRLPSGWRSHRGSTER